MENTEAINNCILDYVEGWYEGDAARMDRALSAHLAKRRAVSKEEVWDVNKDWMIEATGNGRGRIEEPDKGIKEITILDQTESMASVKLVSNKFVDYLHLALLDGDWVIVNALWDFIPE